MPKRKIQDKPEKSFDELLYEGAKKVLEEEKKGSAKYKDAEKVVKKYEAKQPKNEEEDSDSGSEQSSGEESAESSGDEEQPSTSKKSTKRSKVESVAVRAGKKKAAGKTVSGKKAVNSKKEPVKKNYCEKKDEENIVHYEAKIGGDFSVKLSTWVGGNEKNYVQIRKNNAVGANVPAEYFEALKRALDDIATDFDDETVYFYCKYALCSYPPRKHSENAAGYDLYSGFSYIINPHETRRIETYIMVALPPGTYGRIAGRSGLASQGILALGGVIDPDYRGTISVILHNLGEAPYTVGAGDRIAQLIIEKFFQGKAKVLQTLSEYNEVQSDTKRGENGFGSTGIGEQDTQAHVYSTWDDV